MNKEKDFLSMNIKNSISYIERASLTNIDNFTIKFDFIPRLQIVNKFKH